jgi:hypothetical protein
MGKNVWSQSCYSATISCKATHDFLCFIFLFTIVCYFLEHQLINEVSATPLDVCTIFAFVLKANFIIECFVEIVSKIIGDIHLYAAQLQH